jgi:Tn3 transposase DDE domain
LQAAADALSLIAISVTAWNTAQTQVAFDRWATRRSGAMSPTLIGRIAPTRTERMIMRGMFRFSIE